MVRIQPESLKPKLIKTELADYTPAEWTGKNESGYQPISDNILILIDQVLQKTVGGVELPDDLVSRMNLASESGLVVALGPGAFLWSADRRRPFTGDRPNPGVRVYFDRYAGQLLSGDDGRKYRVMTDKCIGAIKL